MTDLAHIRPRSEADFDPGLTPAQMDLLKRTVAADVRPPLTDDELRLFARVAALKGLDPFARQIHVTKRQGKLVIQTGIDGYRLIAERTGRYDGQGGPWWCGEDGQWREVWLSEDPPAAAKVTVHKAGIDRAFIGVAHWREYAQWVDDDRTGRRLNRMWQTMPAGQLAKCAEALALRKAFPQDLSGIYTDDEMGQAEESAAGVVTTPPTPAVAATSVTVKGDFVPKLTDLKQVRSVRDAKQVIQSSTPKFQALIPKAILAVFNADPHAWWDNTTAVDAWRQVLEYAVELHEQWLHEASAVGSVPPPAADPQSDPAPGTKGKGVGPGPDDPVGGDVVAGD